MSPSSHRRSPHVLAAERLAAAQGGVVSRAQLADLGVTHSEINGRLARRHWQAIGRQSVQVHTGPTQGVGLLWAAVFQAGPRSMLDGSSALVAAGLDRWTESRIRVSVPRGARVRRSELFDIRQTRRWAPDDVSPDALPRTRPAVAAVRAALWAASDKAAMHLLSLVVQQGLVSPAQLGLEALRIRRDRRRPLLHSVINELLDGARSLGELRVADELRRRGLPLPERQSVRHSGAGHYYLDMYWPAYRLVVEVDGIHHTWAENVVGDAVRQNALVLEDDRVLRLPLLGLRLEPDVFFAQIEAALRAGGWSPADVMRSVS